MRRCALIVCQPILNFMPSGFMFRRGAVQLFVSAKALTPHLGALLNLQVQLQLQLGWPSTAAQSSHLWKADIVT
jgi:hypothetical protein